LVEGGANVSLDHAFISTNQSEQYGGGIVSVGTLSVTNSTIADNIAGQDGGAILNANILTIDHSTISGNSSSTLGGGIANGLLISSTSFLIGTLNASDVTLSGNTAAGGGGGLNNEVGTATLNNLTLSSNTAISNGGGLRAESGVINLANSIVAGNSSGSSGHDCSGAIVSQGYNLVQDVAGCGLIGDPTGNITGTDPLLGPLQNNGGPTLTRALLAGSPACDAANPAAPGSSATACSTSDQRGVARPQGARCDIGAYEVQPWLLFLPLIMR